MDWKKLTVGIVVPTYGVISGKKSINLHGFVIYFSSSVKTKWLLEWNCFVTKIFLLGF